MPKRTNKRSSGNVQKGREGSLSAPRSEPAANGRASRIGRSTAIAKGLPRVPLTKVDQVAICTRKVAMNFVHSVAQHSKVQLSNGINIPLPLVSCAYLKV